MLHHDGLATSKAALATRLAALRGNSTLAAARNKPTLTAAGLRTDIPKRNSTSTAASTAQIQVAKARLAKAKTTTGLPSPTGLTTPAGLPTPPSPPPSSPVPTLLLALIFTALMVLILYGARRMTKSKHKHFSKVPIKEAAWEAEPPPSPPDSTLQQLRRVTDEC